MRPSDDGDLASPVAFLIRSALGSGYSQFAVDASPPYVGGLNSVPLSDGVYYLASRATDIGGLTESGRTVIPVTVDNTPRTVAISSPLPGQVVGGDLAVAGTFGDAHPGSYVLSYVGPQGGAAREFASGEGARSGSLGALDTRGLVNGDYRLLPRGTDAAGNAVTVERDVTVANARSEILDFTLGADQLSRTGTACATDPASIKERFVSVGRL